MVTVSGYYDLHVVDRIAGVGLRRNVGLDVTSPILCESFNGLAGA